MALNSADENGETKNRTEISIEQIRQMQHSANLPPFEGKFKVFIIDGAEMLSLEAANSLLKTLEEPAENVVFVLLTVNAAAIPETVLSRCQKIELHPVAVEVTEKFLIEKCNADEQKAKLLSCLCHGGIGWAVSAAEDGEMLEKYNAAREEILDIIDRSCGDRFGYAATLAGQFNKDRQIVMRSLDLWLDIWRDIMLLKSGLKENISNIDIIEKLQETAEKFSFEAVRGYIGSIQAAQKQLRQNASPRLVLEVMMLDIPQQRKEAARR